MSGDVGEALSLWPVKVEEVSSDNPFCSSLQTAFLLKSRAKYQGPSPDLGDVRVAISNC